MTFCRRVSKPGSICVIAKKRGNANDCCVFEGSTTILLQTTLKTKSNVGDICVVGASDGDPSDGGVRGRMGHHTIVCIDARRRRSAFPITETELKVIAALAIIGLRRIPKYGYKTPAAIGTPIVL
jgi:hypothetical protein